LFCPPIGHRQERGDYQESWQPARISESDLIEAQNMAQKVTEALGGAGLFGVEFFLTDEGVYFSELSPRPHDTGMVTLAGTQNFNEFESRQKEQKDIKDDFEEKNNQQILEDLDLTEENIDKKQKMQNS
jgi:formate-dependent phosphoribosylglycinamide formyltransferase (GAR transformylase)